VVVDAVTVDAVDPSVVTLVANGSVARAATGKQLWRFLPDDLTAGLLSTADGGVVALNAGAAARRFDAAGNLLWSVGYGASAGDVGALMGDDLLLADAQAVRLIDPTGASIWTRELGAGSPPPLGGAAVTAAASDRAGGVWIVGVTDGTLPPWINAAAGPGPGAGSANPFILHLDATGAVVGGGAWRNQLAFSQAVVAVDAGGQPMLVARAPTYYGWQSVAAFDARGALLWTQRNDTAMPLAVDGAGALFALSLPASDSPLPVQIQHWDPDGLLVASVRAPVTVPPHQRFQVVTAPTPDGFVAVGETVVSAMPSSPDPTQFCTPQHTMFRFQTQGMTATSAPLEGL